MGKEPRRKYFIRFWRYWGNIFSRSWNDIWDYIKGAVAMALLGIIFAIVASLFSANGLLDIAIANGYITDA